MTCVASVAIKQQQIPRHKPKTRPGQGRAFPALKDWPPNPTPMQNRPSSTLQCCNQMQAAGLAGPLECTAGSLSGSLDPAPWGEAELTSFLHSSS